MKYEIKISFLQCHLTPSQCCAGPLDGGLLQRQSRAHAAALYNAVRVAALRQPQDAQQPDDDKLALPGCMVQGDHAN